jgi:hypothetical protein
MCSSDFSFASISLRRANTYVCYYLTKIIQCGGIAFDVISRNVNFILRKHAIFVFMEFQQRLSACAKMRKMSLDACSHGTDMTKEFHWHAMHARLNIINREKRFLFSDRTDTTILKKYFISTSTVLHHVVIRGFYIIVSSLVPVHKHALLFWN